MRSLWEECEAQHAADDLDACVYVSRLLGADPALVLFGGGNTSVKSARGDVQLLHVKGSGADLAQVQRHDFTPVRLDAVCKLIEIEDLSNAALAEAVAGCVLDRNAPRASIETLLHAVLPHKFVLHSHADSILALINSEHGEERAAEVFGAFAPRVPFRESGFALAKAAHEVYRTQAGAQTIGLILLHHGVFSVGQSAREAYANMLRLVELAESYLRERGAWALAESSTPCAWEPTEIAAFRRALSQAAGFPLVLQEQDSPELRAFGLNPRAPSWWDEGPATPQHAVFVKRRPLFGRDIDGYARDYVSELERMRPGADLGKLALDPAPRVIVDRAWGTWTASIDARHASMTATIYRHDVEIISRASAHDRYAGLPRSAILDAEIHYGGFAARARAAHSPNGGLLGEAVLIAGAPDQQQLVNQLRARGAEIAVAGAGAPHEATLLLGAASTSPRSTLRELARRVGGLDVLIVGPDMEDWIEPCCQLLQYSPRKGRLVLNGSSTWCAEQRSRLAAGALRVLELPSPNAQLIDWLCAGNLPEPTLA